jgi:hypothetical protein
MITNNDFFDRKILLMVIAFEALLYYTFYTREVAWYPPDNFDQAGYLMETYRLQEGILTHDLGQVWKFFSSSGHNADVLFPIEGALSGIILGGARLPQLCVLFIAFCTFQVAAFTAARMVWKSRVYGYIALGLIFSQGTLWFQPGGGLFDFRMDFLAYCFYGIWAAAVIRSRAFHDPYWSIGCGLIGAFLVLNRFVTVTYLLGVSVGFAVACAIMAIFWRSDPELASRMRCRLRHLGFSTGLLIIVVVPILIHNWDAIRGYYVVGHVVGEEKYIRAAEMGIKDLAGHLSFYPRSVVQDHLGKIFFCGSAMAIACGLAARLLARWENVPPKPPLGKQSVPALPLPHVRKASPLCLSLRSRRDQEFLLQLTFLLGALLCPIVVLTLDISKSAIVGGIVGGPAALLVVAITAAAASKTRKLDSSHGGRLLVACALVIFVLGLFNQFSHASRHWPAHAQRDDLKRLDELNKCLIDLAKEYQWSSPWISYDVISGWLNAGSPTISAFEQSRELIEFHPMLGNGVMGVGREEAISLLKQSDFLILTTLPKVGTLPFYRRIAEYWGDLKAWADKNMIVARIVPFSAFTATVYVRPAATISGLSGGWIPSHGFSIEAPRDVLERFPLIELAGSGDYSRLQKIPSVEATIDTGESSQTAPASFQRADNYYEIRVNTSSMRLPPADQIHIRLDFSSFFVPTGAEKDKLELVVKAPARVELVRAGS